MIDEKSETLETALYVAMNTLEESALMYDRLARRSRETGQAHAAARFEERAPGSRRQAHTIRQVLVGHEPHPTSESAS